MKTIIDRIGKPAQLEQTAEECVELADAIFALLHLAHGCQKEARRLRGENPTPATEEKCRADIMEEMADVYVCLGRLNKIGYTIDMEMVKSKIDRWKNRIKANIPGNAAISSSDDLFSMLSENSTSTAKIRPGDDLIPRREAMNAIRRKCISTHTPWSSSSPQGRTALAALAAVNGVAAVEWSADEVGRLIYSCAVKRSREAQVPLDVACAQLYSEMTNTFRSLSGIDMTDNAGGSYENERM